MAATTAGNKEEDGDDGDVDEGETAAGSLGTAGVGWGPLSFGLRHLRQRLTCGLVWSVPHFSQVHTFSFVVCFSAFSDLNSDCKTLTSSASLLFCGGGFAGACLLTWQVAHHQCCGKFGLPQLWQVQISPSPWPLPFPFPLPFDESHGAIGGSAPWSSTGTWRQP